MAVGVWTEQEGSGSEFRPASMRFTHPKLGAFTVAVAPVMSPDLSKFGGDYGAVPVAFTVDAATFNREVGWVVSGWHWSVVHFGRVLGSGDELTAEAACKAAEDAVRVGLGRKRAIIAEVWG